MTKYLNGHRGRPYRISDYQSVTNARLNGERTRHVNSSIRIIKRNNYKNQKHNYEFTRIN